MNSLDTPRRGRLQTVPQSNLYEGGINMRKSICALAAVAACTLGFNAQAVVKLEGATANALEVSESGAGHFLVVPYFTTQSGNALLFSLVNMDEVNGKAVKMRFRSARNADTLFDFQVFLAPGDMWTANVSQNSAGLSFLTTADTSCTKPAKSSLNSTPFQTERLNSKRTAAARADETREGYIEIVTMADIPPSDKGLYPLIAANAGTARCANASGNATWTALDSNRAGLSDYVALGMQPPSSGLTANWTIINVPKALSWSGSAFALEARKGGVAALGNLAYFPQVSTTLSNAGTYSADPLFASAKPRLAAKMSELPDISTPYVSATTDPNQQAKALTSLLEVTTVANEFWTDAGIVAATDWLFSMPTRRFMLGVDYSAGSSAALVYNSAMGVSQDTLSLSYWDGESVCDIEPVRSVRDRNGVKSTWADTKEARFNFLCGATSLYSLRSIANKDSGVLGSSVGDGSERSIDISNGWMATSLESLDGKGLPVIGQAFVRAFNPSVAPGTAGNFSVTWPHRLLKN
ncbi:hypothetical protein G7048_14625 [Diaphorobacter sp. HDW4B]|uniref:hypothetical protein n=1 Tax=Diaphorobacter sp. HDW4B TaxID=2714925 RepID=UPI0014096965|nr:hypothetical protein [Diaphorobacter sp. HDW4B]QIL71480.1 hypothetical protein G7048_14625 [Diaphorobacter sp. HDW4B]